MRLALIQMSNSGSMESNMKKSINAIMDFSGESIVVDANGDVIAKADDTGQILYADIELKAASAVRAVRPYTQLRRTEFYK